MVIAVRAHCNPLDIICDIYEHLLPHYSLRWVKYGSNGDPNSNASQQISQQIYRPRPPDIHLVLCLVACACPPDAKNTTSDNLLNQRLQRWEARPELPADAMSSRHLSQHEQGFQLAV